MKEDNNKSSKNKFLKVLKWTCILLISFFIVSTYFLSSYMYKKDHTVSYNDFVKMLENNEIERIEYSKSTTGITFYKKGGNTEKFYSSRPFDTYTEKMLSSGAKLEEADDTLLITLISLLPTFLLLTAVFYLIFSSTGATAIFSNNVSEDTSDNTITFDTYIGGEEIKKELKLYISLMKKKEADLKKKKNRKNKEADKDLKDYEGLIPNCLLFEGPPGVGKTYLAKAFASELGDAKFFYVDCSSIGGIIAGAGVRSLKSLFKKIRKEERVIVFLDEVDSIALRRSEGSTGVESDNRSTLNCLLAELDGYKTEKTNKVLFIAASNDSSVLDPAFMRSGRVDKVIKFELPDKETRVGLFNLYLKGKKKEGIRVEDMSDATEGFSHSDIANICRSAQLLAQYKDGIIHNSTIEDAILELVTRGKIKENCNYDIKEKWLTSIHEAGHAIVSSLMCGEKIQKVSIVGLTSGVGGYTFVTSDRIKTLHGLKNKIRSLYAGRQSELIYNNYDEEKVSFGCSNDVKVITEMMLTYQNFITPDSGVIDYNLIAEGNRKLGDDTAEKLERFAKTLLDETTEFLQENWNKVLDVAEILVKQNTIDYNEFRQIVGLEEEKNESQCI